MFDADLVKQIIAGVITAAALAAWPMRRWKSMDQNIRGLRRDMRHRDRWTRRVLRRFRERLDDHDLQHASHHERLDEVERRLPAAESEAA